ncbi:RagB/SusD family nutrient uptake outer membrane protein [Chryseobacterium wangxinyae]|uniref:RagB/SusD family nutrient uptake outer membrane protein n=1 Tax=Chryseobacterium sp. CY350 TaxID=2997336 RepID=UPI00226FAE45|nr:RagB/SusD family nutrient uptake outer membrane protein [Chryseobacterium sp. CY350]MCY0977048.1 RagB/SusD family nutrient uptake outer membrane protein [Chryseobacterium sp. CY350]WBZ97046.1 RagB/SusD family nutrient uptake outer membrane protein [Chryseobacterium sp. CY350]
MKISIINKSFLQVNMKSLAKALVCGSMMLGMVSCEDDLMLEPENNITQNSFYTTELQIQQALSGVYSAMVNASSRGGYDVNFYLLASEVRSNNFNAISQNGNRDYYAINRFQDTSSTDEMEILWEDAYQQIAYANMLLSRIDAVPFADPATREQYRSEARFLRSYAYFELMRTFGKVPLIDKPVSPDEASKIPRTDLVTLYNFITSEIEASVAGLKNTYDAANKGRITKSAAHAMLGRIYLTGSGFPLHNSSYSAKAKEHLSAVIQGEGQSVTFAANYADLFKSANDNKFHIFEIQHISGGLSQGSYLPSYVSPNFGSADPYYNAQGSLYSSAELGVSQSLIDSYEPGDLRLPLTIKTSFIATNGQPDQAKFFVKFREKGVVLTNRYDWPINFPIIRYADVLLMYAEILNNEGSTNAAVFYLNRIRQRAGLAPVSASISAADFTTALRKERRVEFAGEGVYWHDLVRWNTGVAVINQAAAQLNYNFTITTNDYLYQVPLSQIQVAGYDQNP